MPSLALGLGTQHLCGIFLPAEGGAAPGVSFTDDFNRANADPMSQPAVGTWTNGPGGFGSCKIASNTLEASTAAAYCGARVLTPVFGADQKATVTLSAIAGSFFEGPCVRMQSAVSGSCYHLMTGGSGAILRVYKVTDSTGTAMIAGDFVQLGADIIPAPVLVGGDTISLEAIGTTLNVYQGATLIATRSDATWATGQPGLHVYGGGGNTINAFGCESGGGGALTLGAMVIGTSFTVA